MSSGDGKSSFSSLNVGAAEFIPRQMYETESQQFDLNELTYFINALYNSPEEFFDFAFQLAERLSSCTTTPDIVASIVDSIICQSCGDSNFRYTGARLCSFLSQNLPEELAHSFHAEVLQRCQKDFDQKAEMAAKSPTELIHFTLFLGELMHNFKVSGNVVESDAFHRWVIDLLFDLFALQTDESIRGLMQALKLVGAILDKHQFAKMTDLFSQIRNFLVDTDCGDPRQRAMLLPMMELRAQRWLVDDRTAASTTTAASAVTDAIKSLNIESSKSNNAVSSNNHVAGDVGNFGDENLVIYNDDSEDDDFDDKNFEIVYDGDVQYVVPRDMDDDMEADYERFIAEHEARSK